jgi:hypothetical protein
MHQYGDHFPSNDDKGNFSGILVVPILPSLWRNLRKILKVKHLPSMWTYTETKSLQQEKIMMGRAQIFKK